MASPTSAVAASTTRGGTAAIHGHVYEYSLCLLFSLRSQRLTQNYIFTSNHNKLGSFDDLVARVQYPDKSEKTLLVQSNHVEDSTNPNKRIGEKELFEGKNKEKKFNLVSLYDSYKKSVDYCTSNDLLPCSKFHNPAIEGAEFIIYTNRPFDPVITDRDAVNAWFILQTDGSDKTTQLITTHNEYTNPWVIHPDKYVDVIRECKNRNTTTFDEEGFTKFLPKLKFLVGQADSLELSIRKELELKFRCLSPVRIASLYNETLINIQVWWSDAGKASIDAENKILGISCINLLRTIVPCSETTENQIFHEQSISSLKEIVLNNKIIRISVNKKNKKLWMKKIFQFMHTENSNLPGRCMYATLKLFRSCHSFVSETFRLSDESHFLILDARGVKFNLDDFKRVVDANTKKRLIIVTENSEDTSESINPGTDGILVIGDACFFNELNEATQEQILNYKVEFQGCDVVAKNLITSVKNAHVEVNSQASSVLDSESISSILSNKDLVIGRPVSQKEIPGCYIERQFEIQHYLRDEIIKNRYENDIFVVIGAEKSDQKENEEVFFVPENSTKFEDLVKEETAKNIHLLAQTDGQRNNLRWLKTHGKIDTLVNFRTHLDSQDRYSEDKAICANGNKIAILSDVAGIGKTIAFQHIAKSLKSANPSTMVLQIDLNKCNNIPSEMEHETDAVKKLLNLLSLNDDTKISRGLGENLLTHKIARSGDIVLLFDAFDEMSAKNQEYILHMILELRETMVSKIIVASRPLLQKTLESKLSQFSVTLSRVTRQQQIDFLTEHWNASGQEAKESAENLIQIFDESLKEQFSDFVGIPLHLRMLAELYCDCWHKEPLKSYDILSLYEAFLKKKFELHLGKHYFLRLSENDFDNEFKTFLQPYTEYAAGELFIGKEKLFTPQTSEKLKNRQAEIKHKFGLCSNDEHGCLIFIHRTFVEYLSSQYILDNWEHYKDHKDSTAIYSCLLSEILVEERFSVIRLFIDCNLKDRVVKTNIQKALKNPKMDKIYQTKPLSKISETFLHVAARENNLNIVKTFTPLLRRYPEFLNMRDQHDQTALFVSALEGKLEILKHLMSNHCDIETADKYNRTPLFAAADSGHTSVVKYLIDSGADVTTKLAGKHVLKLSCYLVEDWTALHVAAFRGHAEIAEALVTKDGSLHNVVDSENRTAIQVAMLGLKLGVLEKLQIYHEWSKDTVTLIELLFKKQTFDETEVRKSLLDLKAPLDLDVGGWNVLQLASFHNNSCVASFIVNNKFLFFSENTSLTKVIQGSGNQFSPLHVASENGNLKLVKVLVEKLQEENFNSKKKISLSECVTLTGWTLMHAAAERNRLEVMEYLTDQGFDPNVEDKSGITPLHIASFRNHYRIVQFLIEILGCDIYKSDKWGANCLSYSAVVHNCELVKYFMEKLRHKTIKLNPNTIEGKLNMSELHILAGYGNLEIIKFLLEHKTIDVNDGVKSEIGVTALHIAALFERKNVYDYLVEKEGDENVPVKIPQLLHILKNATFEAGVEYHPVQLLAKPVSEMFNTLKFKFFAFLALVLYWIGMFQLTPAYIKDVLENKTTHPIIGSSVLRVKEGIRIANSFFEHRKKVPFGQLTTWNRR